METSVELMSEWKGEQQNDEVRGEEGSGSRFRQEEGGREACLPAGRPRKRLRGDGESREGGRRDLWNSGKKL